jgi:hypothetical protein
MVGRAQTADVKKHVIALHVFLASRRTMTVADAAAGRRKPTWSAPLAMRLPEAALLVLGGTCLHTHLQCALQLQPPARHAQQRVSVPGWRPAGAADGEIDTKVRDVSRPVP